MINWKPDRFAHLEFKEMKRKPSLLAGDRNVIVSSSSLLPPPSFLDPCFLSSHGVCYGSLILLIAIAILGPSPPLTFRTRHPNPLSRLLPHPRHPTQRNIQRRQSHRRTRRFQNLHVITPAPGVWPRRWRDRRPREVGSGEGGDERERSRILQSERVVRSVLI